MRDGKREFYFFMEMDILVALTFEGYYWTHRTVRNSIEKNNLEEAIRLQSGHTQKLIYLGVDTRLVAQKARLNRDKSVRRMSAKEKKVHSNVQSLIKTSMENYYFEKIGNALIDLRNTPTDQQLRANIMIYIDSYNAHVPPNKKINARTLLKDYE